MGSIAVGMALHGGIIPYTATFLTFADYMRPPMRLAAMMGLRAIFVFTHDSIGVGEDGPTHQPVEQIMNLRQVPNMTVIRPADANETMEAWRMALINTSGPTTLACSAAKIYRCWIEAFIAPQPVRDAVVISCGNRRQIPN